MSVDAQVNISRGPGNALPPRPMGTPPGKMPLDTPRPCIRCKDRPSRPAANQLTAAWCTNCVDTARSRLKQKGQPSSADAVAAWLLDHPEVGRSQEPRKRAPVDKMPEAALMALAPAKASAAVEPPQACARCKARPSRPSADPMTAPWCRPCLDLARYHLTKGDEEWSRQAARDWLENNPLGRKQGGGQQPGVPRKPAGVEAPSNTAFIVEPSPHEDPFAWLRTLESEAWVNAQMRLVQQFWEALAEQKVDRHRDRRAIATLREDRGFPYLAPGGEP